jgi:hypothetical protein
MPTDPLDKQLVEAVLTRPRRAKADLEEAKLAGLRPSRNATAVADEEDSDDDDLDLPVALEDEAEDDTVEVVVGEGSAAEPGSRLPAEGPTKLDPKEVEEPTAEELEALSADDVEGVRRAGDKIRGEELRPDRGMRADERALVALDAERGIPGRNFQRDVPLLELRRARRPAAIERNRADGLGSSAPPLRTVPPATACPS